MQLWVGLSLVLATSAPFTASAQTLAGNIIQVVGPDKATIIHLLSQPSTVNTGPIEKQALIASIAYSYNQPIRLTQDYKMGWATGTLPAGTLGFEAGTFTARYGGRFQVYCLFGTPFHADNPYARPFCFMDHFITFLGKPKAGALDTTSNIQTFFSGNPGPIDPPQVETTTAPIDHDFRIEINFKRWFKNIQGVTGIVVYYKSEGRIVNEEFLAVDNENTLKLGLRDGILALKIDPADQDHIIASFSKSAPSPDFAPTPLTGAQP